MGVGRRYRPTTSFAILLTLLFSLMGGVVAHAQVTGATLSGTVTDPSGGVVVGAQVSAKDAATGVTKEATSDSAGLYTIPNLAPSTYEVRVTAAGFSTAVQANLQLSVGQQQQLNFAMKVGETNTTVQVTEAAPQIDLTSSALTGQVESETVRELPLNGRDWTSLAVLQPGVKPIETQMSYSTSARGNRGFGSELTVSGQRSTFNNYRIDGISVVDYANAAPGNVIGVVLGVDAIQEFSVLTGGFPAEYGRATGGVVNAISKSGTNQFHGDVYEFLRNSALDANDYFTKSSGATIPPFKRNQFGASAGGPIIKDKTFIFGDYEGLRQTKGIPTSVGVPSVAARGGTFQYDTATNPDQSICPTTIPSVFNGATEVSPGTCVVPTINSYSQSLLALWPLPTTGVGSSGAAANLGQYVFAGVQQVPENFFTIRVDHKLGNNDSLFGTYLRDSTNYTEPDVLNTVLTQSQTTRQTVALEENHTFSSSFVNAARFGFNRDHVINAATPSAINPAAASLALGALAGQAAPRLTVHGGVSDFFAGINGASHYTFGWNSFQYGDDAFWTKGAHTIKFGGSVERMQDNEHTFQEPGGRYQFADVINFEAGNPKSWEASLSPAVGGEDNPREFRQTLFSAYIQDDWKIKSNLTLNLGIRYEPSTVLTDAQGRLTNLATITATSPTCGVAFNDTNIPASPGSSCGSVGPYYQNATLRNFEPRLGFAWDPLKDGKTSVRGGFGIYDVDPLPGYFLLQQNQAGPFLIFKSIHGSGNFQTCGPLNNSCLTTTAFANGFQPQEGGFQLEDTTSSLLAESTVEGQPHRSYVMQWNLNIQRQLTSDMSLTVGYVGSHGVHLLMRGDDGNMAGAPGSAAPYQTTPYGYLFPCGPPVTATGCTPGATSTGANAQVNPSLGIIRYVYWNTDSHYNGLDVNLDKKFAHGFQFQLGYTFSKSLDDDSQTIAGDTFANGINSPWWFLPKAFYGPSDFNVAHTLTVNGLYSVPTPKFGGPAAAYALGGWELGGIFTYNSGTPTTPINNADPLGLGNSGADQFGPLVKVAGCNPIDSNYAGSNPGSPQYINPACYTEPYLPTAVAQTLKYPCASFSSPAQPAPTGQTYCANLSPFNIGRNSITGPKFYNMDFSILKNFPVKRISEAFNVQFRAEMFNIFNHDNFVPPQPCSGDCNAGLFDSNGATTSAAGQIHELAGLPREIQFALKVGW
ncbi:MAG TPA: TonB-dependent receptor [Candidatus Saccharimonadales bacterium]|jgi:hypothetical protein|nr:TonB-dependent receptor [Candidatus Saccharimonadales bacterium]